MNLYEIEKEYKVLCESAENIYQNGTKEEIESFESNLILNHENFNNKALNYTKLLKILESNINAIDNEINRLEEIKKTKEKTFKLLKDKLSNSMQTFGILELDFNIFKLNFRKSKSIEIIDNTLIPDNFLVTKTTKTPDKIALKKAIEQGEIIEGVELIEKKQFEQLNKK